MDVSLLASGYDAAGPFATVCADVTHSTESAAAEVELRVRAATAELGEQGAPEAVVEAARSRLMEVDDSGDAGTLKGRALAVAADGTVVLDEALVDAPLRQIAEWSPQPNLLPVLRFAAQITSTARRPASTTWTPRARTAPSSPPTGRSSPPPWPAAPPSSSRCQLDRRAGGGRAALHRRVHPDRLTRSTP